MSRKDLANAIRALSMDAVQKANSGHPGAPMGMADIAEVLWNDFLKHNPTDPTWYDRDRFILSNGHASMLLYSLLHLTGYDLPLEELKNFRQLHSKTPGHPEIGYTPGVETTTGPLGQGLANAVGLAIAERTLAAQFNQPDHEIVDHFTYVFMGDGCLMEGISHEVCSLAGTLGLGKLIGFYDHNGIDLQGILRAGLKGVASGFHFSEGASTITQQLLKNTVFTQWTSEQSMADKFERKFQEQYLALQLEKVVDKDWILENYLNAINLGQNTLGVGVASERYFGKDVSELTLSECAVLAAITQSPSYYNPITHPDHNKERRQKVLNNMLDQGYISQTEYDEAVADNVYDRIQVVNVESQDENINSYFVDEMTDQIVQDMIDRLAAAAAEGKEKGVKGLPMQLGIEMAAEMIARIKDEHLCDGVHIMAIGAEKNVPTILEKAGVTI